MPVSVTRFVQEGSMKFRFALAAVAAALLAIAGVASAQQPIVIKFSHVVAVDTPEGQGRRLLQEARRGADQGPRQGRGLPEQLAVQGRRGDGGAAARLGAAARAVAREVRPARRARVRGVRPAVHLRRLQRAAQGHRRARRRRAVQEARAEGHRRSRLLGQRLQGDEREQADPRARRLQGPQDAHPVVEGAGRRDEGARARFRR